LVSGGEHPIADADFIGVSNFRADQVGRIDFSARQGIRIVMIIAGNHGGADEIRAYLQRSARPLVAGPSTTMVW